MKDSGKPPPLPHFLTESNRAANSQRLRFARARIV